jgi:hypothetical protein
VVKTLSILFIISKVCALPTRLNVRDSFTYKNKQRLFALCRIVGVDPVTIRLVLQISISYDRAS